MNGLYVVIVVCFVAASVVLVPVVIGLIIIVASILKTFY